MILVAVSSTVPSNSLRSTLCFLAALSTGSGQLMYWRVTSRSSSITFSLEGTAGIGGKSSTFRFRPTEDLGGWNGALGGVTS